MTIATKDTVSYTHLDEENKRANVYLNPEEVSLAIGKGGLNIKLASQLTGYEIDVYRELETAEEEDVNLEEFSDEIEPWVIEELKRDVYKRQIMMMAISVTWAPLARMAVNASCPGVSRNVTVLPSASFTL